MDRLVLCILQWRDDSTKEQNIWLLTVYMAANCAFDSFVTSAIVRLNCCLYTEMVIAGPCCVETALSQKGANRSSQLGSCIINSNMINAKSSTHYLSRQRHAQADVMLKQACGNAAPYRSAFARMLSLFVNVYNFLQQLISAIQLLLTHLKLL